MWVVVIGVGFLGLVILKYLFLVCDFLGFDFVELILFEFELLMGGMFVYCIYEDGEVCLWDVLIIYWFIKCIVVCIFEIVYDIF